MDALLCKPPAAMGTAVDPHERERKLQERQIALDREKQAREKQIQLDREREVREWTWIYNYDYILKMYNS